MQINTYILGELGANCYFLFDEKSNSGIIIDPADDGVFIAEKILRKNISLLAFIATHGHFDHIMAVGELQLSFSVPLYVSINDMFLIKRLKTTAKHFLGYDPHILYPHRIKNIHEGHINIGPFSFSAIFCPGHTPGCYSFYFPKKNIVFTGDTLFKNSIGRYDYPYSNFYDLQKSLQKLFSLPGNTQVYPGHGEKTVISKEKSDLSGKLFDHF